LVAAVVSVFVLAGVAPAAEFSADVVTTGAGGGMKGKIYLKGGNMRQEVAGAPAGKAGVTIFRADKRVTWLLQPAQRTYREIRGSGGMHDPGWEKEVEKLAVKKSLGTDMMNGQLCDKYLFIYRDKSTGTMTLWVSKRLKFPVKTVAKSARGSMTMECKNIREGRLPDSLFEVPAGYKKMEMPAMPPGMRGMPGMPHGRR
jgi:hypothetical protein